MIEQQVYSFYHNGHVFLSVMIFVSSLGVLCSEKIDVSRYVAPNVGFNTCQVNKLALFFCFSFVVLLYVNIFISDTPPLLSSGYVDRFGYMENTKIWFFLKIFGVVSIHIPIVLGYLLAHLNRKYLVVIVFLFYELYLVLIGQKFGGPLLGIIFFALPTLSLRYSSYSLGHFLKSYFLKVMLAFIFLMSVVYYHYSNYSLAEDFGGPFGLILYRVFGMQGHMFWGVLSEISWIHSDLLNFPQFVNAMQNLMLKVSPVLAPEMIERGVNFTFGFYAAIAYYFSILAFFIAFFSFMVFGLISKLWFFSLKQKRLVGYFFVSNVLVMFASFISMGSLASILNPKFFVLIVFLGMWPVLAVAFRKIFKTIH
ncbi:DUF6418 domain-containing protein [Marinobacter shengliensis]|uniref:DUF6418 domain-containing protein n=1 Tax=Marinobacter shengliensis TaxID=1389223 RepID=UPI0011B213B3|nr:DUF6418 domain-containing protein [Marinobacter shengliensis]